MCSLLIMLATEINGHFCEKCCSCVIGGITTQLWGATLGSTSKKVGKHWFTVTSC